MSFDCSLDVEIWPWLKLPATHPIVVQTANFWASVESGMTLGTFDPNKWSALVQTEWTCGLAQVGHAVRGDYATIESGERQRYGLHFYDAEDRLVSKMTGQGVIFRTRNFEGWRGETKEKIVKPELAHGFEYAASEAVDVETPAEVFLSPLRDEGQVFAEGLVTKETGLLPGHPYIGGSGDHVNSTHMGEIGRQFGALLLGRPVRNTEGEMVFMHYVELGRPFRVDLVSHDEAAFCFELLVRQVDRDCTSIIMTYAA
ncbi:MAG: hypothetical protein NXH72_02560 [Hyphomonadaceae bacterium]|nr:hypothetical protein [Hyphomonadaceae bacterium]